MHQTSIGVKTMRYAVWNNKGGVGKSFLSFVLSTELANKTKQPVILVDMCPQANLSEIVLGGNGIGSERLDQFIRDRNTVGGYFDTRISSPHEPTGKEAAYLIHARPTNPKLPDSLYLIAGDPSLELQAQVINQISGQSLPTDAWKNVHNWLKDLISSCMAKLGVDRTIVFIDCNPSFSAYTEVSMIAAEPRYRSLFKRRIVGPRHRQCRGITLWGYDRQGLWSGKFLREGEIIQP